MILTNATITHIYSDVEGYTHNLKNMMVQEFPLQLIFENEEAAVFEVR